MTRISKKTTLKTELGFEIKVTASHKIAEQAAALKEAADDAKARFKKIEDELLEQMISDQITSVKVRTTAGLIYEATRENKGEKIKFKQIAQTRDVRIEKVTANAD